jgi:hypothetical protein
MKKEKWTKITKENAQDDMDHYLAGVNAGVENAFGVIFLEFKKLHEEDPYQQFNANDVIEKIVAIAPDGIFQPVKIIRRSTAP